MKVFLFGATGETGNEVLTKLLEQKHQVLVLVRNLNVISVSDNHLKVVRGSVLKL